MCGIFGIYNNTKESVLNLATKVLRGLSLLEYRGYDSAGVLLQNNTGHAIICKTAGNVGKLSNQVSSKLALIAPSPIYNIGISHTRWATHGEPSDVNSHPHTSDANVTFAVVHNGIITNYKDLRNILEDNGFVFESQTDTEVIPKLCLLTYNENPSLSFDKLIHRVIGMLEGSFALLVTSRIYPNEIVACKHGSPLIIGREANSYAFSSDITALVESSEVCIMQDKEILHVKPNEAIMFECHHKSFPISWVSNTITKEDVHKGEHDTYMKKEIFEQPMAIMRTINNYTFNDASNRLGVKFDTIHEFSDKIRRAQAVFLIACGTSWHSCLASRWLISRFLEKHVFVEVAGQFVEVGQKTSSDFVYVFVSQSGETSETVEALRYVKNTSPSALCIAITNKPSSTLARESACSIDLKAGLEISVASTKAYTSQMVALSLLAVCFKQGLLFQPSKCNMLPSLMRIPDLIKNTLLTTERRVIEIAPALLKYNSILFVGRGADYATALEAALKVKEITYVHSEGVMASELKHGPLAMIDDGVCIFVFATQNRFYKRMISVIEQLKARKSHIYVICNEDDKVINTLMNDPKHVIEVPHCEGELQHIINIVPMQLLAYYLATIKGNTVDQPRNLAKSVTVSD